MTDAELIADVEARYPDLDTAGFPGDRRNGPYPKLSADHCGFAIARAFLEAGAPGGRRHRDGYYSYGLKHAAEDWAMAKGTPDYVGNGAMIGAAVASGWSVRRDSINAWLKPPSGSTRATTG